MRPTRRLLSEASTLLRSASRPAGPRLRQLADLRWAPGDQVAGGFRVSDVVHVDALQLVAVELEHAASGARHLHVGRLDANNAFAVGFLTPPTDHTGVAHICEHVVLCGSRRYPVRDPFFKMAARSLATYMNAWTLPDATLYPFATQNARDYVNLLDVYLDAVFHPRLAEEDFRQEGWRLEPTGDVNQPWVIKGVVYNEMRGVLGDVQSLYGIRRQGELWTPPSPYGYNSGGEPAQMTQLSHEKLVDFHRRCYSPGNARFMSYGDMPLEITLERVGEVLATLPSSLPPPLQLPDAPRWTQPRRVCIAGPADAFAAQSSRQTRASVTWRLGRATDAASALRDGFFASLFVGGPTTPAYRRLIDSHMGSDYTPGTGYDGESLDGCLSVGLEGLEANASEALEKAVLETVDAVSRDGFDAIATQAALRQLEYRLRHQSASFGITLAGQLVPAWLRGARPLEDVRVDSLLNGLRTEVSNLAWAKSYAKQLLGNPHRLTFTMVPSETYDVEAEMEQRQLDSVSSTATVSIEGEAAARLSESQARTEDLSCLPFLSPERDVEPHVVREHVWDDWMGTTPVQLSVQPTNGLAYVHVALDMLPAKGPDEAVLQLWLPLVAAAMTQMGAGERGVAEAALAAQLLTGNLASEVVCTPDPVRNGQWSQHIELSTSVLKESLGDSMRLLRDHLARPVVTDLPRLQSLVHKLSSDAAATVAEEGHEYASLRASARWGGAYRIAELQRGVSQVRFLQFLSSQSDWNAVGAVLERLMTCLAVPGAARIAVAADVETLAAACAAIPTLLGRESAPLRIAALGAASQEASVPPPGAPSPIDLTSVAAQFAPGWACMRERNGHAMASLNLPVGNEYLVMPFGVHHCARSFKTVPWAHAETPLLTLAARIATTKWIHRAVREGGGAYGAGAQAGNGTLCFFSYRDPHDQATLDAFDGCIAWLLGGHFGAEAVSEAKLTALAALDAPVSPGFRGTRRFAKGITDGMRQRWREHLLAASRDGIVEVCHRYLRDVDSRTVVIGTEAGARGFRSLANWSVSEHEPA